MKAVVLWGPDNFGTVDIDTPDIKPNEILLKLGRAAICGTDIRILEGKKTTGIHYPSVIGHEFCGVVERVGKEVSGYTRGERVAIANVIPCGRCACCLSGRENACLNMVMLGYHFDGGFAEYVRIPAVCIKAGNVVKLPDSISFTSGALIEPLACCIRGMLNAGVKFGDKVVIIGAGPIGLMHLQLARIAGASKVIVSEPNAFRRAKAREFGADIALDPDRESLNDAVLDCTEGLGADVAILAIGAPLVVGSLLKLCRPGGTLCIFAGFAGTGECSVEANVIHYREINVCGSTAYRRSDYLTAAEMVSAGRIKLETLATHEFSLDDFAAAYEMCKSGTGLKIMIKP